MALTETTPRAGDNSGDPHAAAYADFEARVRALMEAGDVWEKRDELDDVTAAKANDFLSGASKLASAADKAREAEKKPHLQAGREVDAKWKKLTERREAEKKPHLQAGREVDAKWKKLTERIAKIVAIVKPKLAEHMRQKEAERRAAAEEERKRAEEAKRAADAARMDAANAQTASQRMEAEERAEEHARIADVAADKAEDLSGKARVQSATGLANTRALRTVRRPEIVSLPQALAHYRDHLVISDAILALAATELRHAPTIDGVKQVPSIPGIKWVESQEL